MRRFLPPILIAFFGVSAGFSQTFTDGDWSYTLNTNNEATITGYSGSGGVLAIPASVDGYLVRTFGNGSRMFVDPINTTITSATIPEGVTSIGVYAFLFCYDLTNVSIPDSVTNIGFGAFYHCHALTNVTIPNNVTSIGDYAFFSCRSLSDVTIPDGVASIGERTFSRSGLASVKIGSSVKTIGDYAFEGCLHLTSLVIPDSVTSIGAFAFADCFYMTNATIGSGVTSIGMNAFMGCGRLTSILFEGAPPALGPYVFLSIAPNAVAYFLPPGAGLQSTFAGLPTRPFVPTVQASNLTPASGFQFTWTGTGSVPMSVLRATSLVGSWTLVSSNNATGQFTDTNPPTGQAFYRTSLP